MNSRTIQVQDNSRKSPKLQLLELADSMNLESSDAVVTNDGPSNGLNAHTEFIFQRLLEPNVFREKDPLQTTKDDDLLEYVFHSAHNLMPKIDVNGLPATISPSKQNITYSALSTISRDLMNNTVDRRGELDKSVREPGYHDVGMDSVYAGLQPLPGDLESILDSDSGHTSDQSVLTESKTSEVNEDEDQLDNSQPRTDGTTEDSVDSVHADANIQDNRSANVSSPVANRVHDIVEDQMSANRRHTDIGCGLSCLKRRIVMARRRKTRRSQYAVDRQYVEFLDYFEKRKARLQPKNQNMDLFIINNDSDGLCKADRCDVLVLVFNEGP